jgi:hypothetical protein
MGADVRSYNIFYKPHLVPTNVRILFICAIYQDYQLVDKPLTLRLLQHTENIKTLCNSVGVEDPSTSYPNSQLLLQVQHHR